MTSVADLNIKITANSASRTTRRSYAVRSDYRSEDRWDHRSCKNSNRGRRKKSEPVENPLHNKWRFPPNHVTPDLTGLTFLQAAPTRKVEADPRKAVTTNFAGSRPSRAAAARTRKVQAQVQKYGTPNFGEKEISRAAPTRRKRGKKSNWPMSNSVNNPCNLSARNCHRHQVPTGPNIKDIHITRATLTCKVQADPPQYDDMSYKVWSIPNPGCQSARYREKQLQKGNKIPPRPAEGA